MAAGPEQYRHRLAGRCVIRDDDRDPGVDQIGRPSGPTIEKTVQLADPGSNPAGPRRGCGLNADRDHRRLQ